MNSDSYFAIGHSHHVCEDYAFAGPTACSKTPIAVVSDGCSTAPNTDIGSRILTRAILLNYPLNLSESIRGAYQATKTLGLTFDSLFATILTLEFTPENQIKAQVSGDGGVIARKRESQELEVYWLNYCSNAPEYLAYLLHTPSYSRFLDSFGNQKAAEITTLGPDGEVKSSFAEFPEDLVYERYFDPADYDLIAVTSDGVDSFAGLGYIDVIKRIMSFKNYKGEFVKRRVKRFLKEIAAEKIRHDDDVSLAAIYLK